MLRKQTKEANNLIKEMVEHNQQDKRSKRSSLTSMGLKMEEKRCLCCSIIVKRLLQNNNICMEPSSHHWIEILLKNYCLMQSPVCPH